MGALGAPDFFYREARRLGYAARSAFKIQQKHRVIEPGATILDLGCAPGSWLQVACQCLGHAKHGGAVVGIDLKKMKAPPNHCDSRVHAICADVMDFPLEKLRSLSPQNGFSVILSDMCPSISGITTKDAALSMELGTRVVGLALGESHHSSDPERCAGGLLQTGGNLVIKMLQSEDMKEIHGSCKPLFQKTLLLWPKATRSASREIYLICKGMKPMNRPERDRR